MMDPADQGRTYYPSALLRRRQWLTALCLLIVPGTLVPAIAYGLHLRSAGYRESTERMLADRLGMAVEIGAIRPSGVRGRELFDMRVYLRPGGTEVFRCASALWTPSDADTDDVYLLELARGSIMVGTTVWGPSEFEKMLAGGLGHPFATIGLRDVRLSEMDIRFAHGPTEFVASGTTGVLIFGDDGEGRASVSCTRLNGVTVEAPVNIAVRFTPMERAPPLFHEVRLNVPTMPLAALGLDRLVGRPMSRGTFSGTIRYRRDGGVDVVEISGSLDEADLAALTATSPFGSLRGNALIELEDATFRDGRLTRLGGAGHLSGLDLTAALPGLFEGSSEAKVDVRLDDIDWRDGRLLRLAGSANCSNLSLQAVTHLIGHGEVTGTATVDIRSFAVVDDRLRVADLVVTAVPPADGPAIISRDVLAAGAEQWLGVDVSSMLPERVEYMEFGARLIIEDRQLRVRGTHGPDGRTILTINLFGRPWGILREPRRTYELPDVVALTRERAERLTVEDIRTWWQTLREPVSQPETQEE